MKYSIKICLIAAVTASLTIACFAQDASARGGVYLGFGGYGGGYYYRPAVVAYNPYPAYYPAYYPAPYAAYPPANYVYAAPQPTPVYVASAPVVAPVLPIVGDIRIRGRF